MGNSGETRPAVDCLERLFTERWGLRGRRARDFESWWISDRGVPAAPPAPTEADNEGRDGTLDSLGRGAQAVDEVDTLRDGLSCVASKDASLGAKIEEGALKGSTLSRPELELDPGLDGGARSFALLLSGLDGERRRD